MAKKPKAVGLFEDMKGREWFVRFNGANFRRIKEELGINLSDAQDDLDAFMQEHWANLDSVLKMVWFAIERQAEEQKVSEEDWLEQIYSDATFSIRQAWVEGVINFSLPGDVKDKSIEAFRATMDATMGAIDDQTREIDMEAIRREAREKIGGLSSQRKNEASSDTDSSSNSPDSSASIPIDEPIES